MRFSRLFQPRNPLFWLLIVLNLLSAALSTLIRSSELSSAVVLILGGFALANALIGIVLALRLMSDDRQE